MAKRKKKSEYQKFISDITFEEGGKVEISRGNAIETVGIIARKFVQNPIATMMLLNKIGSRKRRK